VGDRVQEGAQALLVEALAHARELLAYSDVSSGEHCIKVEEALGCFQDLLESGCAELRLTGRAVLALGGQQPTKSALDHLRSRWKA